MTSDFESIVAGLGLEPDVRETVLDIDADWFAAHPKQRVRLRRLLDGEFGDAVPDGLTERDGPHMVVVIRNTVRILVRPLLFEVTDEEADR